MAGSFDAHKGKVEAIRFTPKGDQLITLGGDKRARIWKVSDWSDQGVIEGVAYAFDISANGRWFVSRDLGDSIWLWDLTTLKKSVQLSKSGGGTDFKFTPDDSYVGCSYGGKPYFIDVKSKENIEIPVSVEGGKTTKVKIEPQGNNQASISLGQMQDDDAPTYRVVPGNVSPIVVLSRRWINGFIDIWDLHSHVRLKPIYLPKDDSEYKILEITISFDDSYVAIAGNSHVGIWDIKTSKRVMVFDGSGLIQFSPTDNELALVTKDKLNFCVMKK